MTAGADDDYYFRIRDNGAAVFRLNATNRNSRLEMEEIAVVNIRNGNVKPHGDRLLTEHDREVIRDWMARRSALLALREMDDVHRAVDQLNLVAQWAQSRATDDQLDAVSDALLWAMHDLRSVLVRRKADRLAREGQAPASDG